MRVDPLSSVSLALRLEATIVGLAQASAHPWTDFTVPPTAAPATGRLTGTPAGHGGCALADPQGEHAHTCHHQQHS
jgi:hypothetical protein